MDITRWRTLATVFGLSLALGFGLTALLVERWPGLMTVPWTGTALVVLVAAGLIWVAWPVRQFVHGQRTWIDPLRAAGVLAFAKACALAGSGLAGLWLAVVVRAALIWESPVFRERALLAGLAAVAAGVLMAAGLVAEHWCRLPPDRPTEEGAT